MCVYHMEHTIVFSTDGVKRLSCQKILLAVNSFFSLRVYNDSQNVRINYD